MSKKYLLLFLLSSFLTCMEAKERFSNLNIIADISYSPALHIQQQQTFRGEFFPDDFFTPPIWNSFDSTETLVPGNRHWSVSGRLGFNFWKGLYVGLRYSMLQITDYSRPGVSGGLFIDADNTFFFFVGFSAGYIFQPISQAPAFTIQPIVSAGTFLGNEYYSGPGRKWHFNSGVKFSYLFKQKYGLYIAPSHTFLQYKDSGRSAFFNEDTLDRINLQLFQLEVGLSFQINIERKPD